MSLFISILNRILQECLDVVFPPRSTEILVRNTRLKSLVDLFAPQILHISGFEIVTLLPYQSEITQAFILEAKFHNNRKAQDYLGQILLTYIGYTRENPINMVIVPLPLGKKRRKERGYNQIEEIATFAQKRANASFPPSLLIISSKILVRTRETAPQTSLGRHMRLKNMEGAFGISDTCIKNGGLNTSCTYVLFDDVVTTGSSLLAARATLIHAGAERVLLLALAH